MAWSGSGITTAMSKPSRAAEFLGRLRAKPAAWLLSAAGLVLMPKCLLCLAGYAGLGTALGLAGAEICGAPPRGPSGVYIVSAALGVAWFVVLVRPERPPGPRQDAKPETQPIRGRL